MNHNASISLPWARCAKRSFLYFVLCLIALGTWSIPAPEPLSVAGDFKLFEHFYSDQSGALSQHESAHPLPPEYMETVDGKPALGPPHASVLLALIRLSLHRAAVRARLPRRAPYRAQPRAPPHS